MFRFRRRWQALPPERGCLRQRSTGTDRKRTRLDESRTGKAGLTVWDSCANYLFFEGPKGLAARLEKGGILIRDCSNYPGLADGYYRAAVRTHEENQILTEAVSQILQWF